MKIGILTLPLHTNFGGILQAYALQTTLERMGHNVEVLQNTTNIGNTFHSLIMPLVYAKRIARNILSENKIPIFFERKAKREIPIIRQHTDRFLAQYLKLREIKHLSEINPSDYDAIVVGSDQVWRAIYFKGMWQTNISDAFLDFTKGWEIKRIAYAASFGVDNWEYNKNETRLCADAAKIFDAISVREDSGVKLCREKLNVEATHVLDPTMLLNKDDYMTLVSAANTPESSGDMLCYILDPTPFKTFVVNKIATEQSLTPFNVNAQIDNHSLDVNERIQPPVEQWLRGFHDAKYVVTDSFHACVFSIIFGKPFIAIGNASRGMTRFSSLLRQFGLESRLITETNSALPVELSILTEIDELLSRQIQISRKFLNDNLI